VAMMMKVVISLGDSKVWKEGTGGMDGMDGRHRMYHHDCYAYYCCYYYYHCCYYCCNYDCYQNHCCSAPQWLPSTSLWPRHTPPPEHGMGWIGRGEWMDGMKVSSGHMIQCRNTVVIGGPEVLGLGTGGAHMLSCFVGLALRARRGLLVARAFFKKFVSWRSPRKIFRQSIFSRGSPREDKTSTASASSSTGENIGMRPGPLHKGGGPQNYTTVRLLDAAVPCVQQDFLYGRNPRWRSRVHGGNI